MPQYIEKDPESHRDIGVQLRSILPSGVTITDVTVTVPLSSGLTVLGDSFSGTLLAARISGGTAGVRNARVKFSAVWSDGQRDVRSVYVTVVEK